MFESLRKNIQSVHDGITAGLQRLSSSGGGTTPTDSKAPELQGGEADLLTMYQSQWATMHHMALQNAKLAQTVADNISSLTEECETQHSQLLEVRSLLAHLPNIMAQLHSSLSTIGSLRSVLEEVEIGLVSLEDVIEEATFQEEVLDMKMELTLKTQERQHRLNTLNKELSSEHVNKMKALEMAKEGERRMKEAALAQKLEHDLQQYREHGIIEKTDSSSKQSNLKLEDVSIEEDPTELEKFLDDEEEKPS